MKILCLILAIVVATECSVDKDAQFALCPSGMTDCGLGGCCPLPSAVCCSDGVHCCPNGYRCDYSVGGCVRDRMFSPFMDKIVF